MKIAKRLLSSLMIFIVLLQSIIVYSVQAEEMPVSAEYEASETYEDMGGSGDVLQEDTGNADEIIDGGEAGYESDNEVNEDENEDTDSGENISNADVSEDSNNNGEENENNYNDGSAENDETGENILTDKDGQDTESTEGEDNGSGTSQSDNESESAGEENTAEAVSEGAGEENTAEAVSESEAVTYETVTEVSSVAVAEDSSTGGSSVYVPEKVTEETTAESVTEGIFGTISPLAGAGETSHRVELVLNGGKFDDEDWESNVKIVIAGGSVILPVPEQTGAVFAGWSTGDDNVPEYSGGQELMNIRADMRLFAVWKWEEYSVTFVENTDDGSPLWQVNIEYGYELWLDRSVTPWLDIKDEEWTEAPSDENNEPVYKASADFNTEEGGEPVYVEVTKRQNRDNEGNVFVYYTFEYENTKWFTAAEGIIPEKEGFTFRDWYMTEPEAGGNGIKGNTVYMARYLDTGGYIANINYKYINKKTAADSTSVVLEYNSEGGNTYIDFEFSAPEIEGFYPVIKSSSVNGIELIDSEGNLINMPSQGLDLFTERIEKTDESGQIYNEYIYKIRLNMENASFTTPEGETIQGGSAEEEARIHSITFNIEYNPVAAEYRVNYFREVLGSDPTQHSGEYELYEYVNVEYDEEKEVWNIVSYAPGDGAHLKAEKSEINGLSYYEYDSYKAVSTHVITNKNDGYYNGDTVIPENREYEGFVIASVSLELTDEGAQLGAGLNNINLFYSREDYHMYYITDSESAETENVLYVYGGNVSVPDGALMNKAGYVFEGWVYYTDVPQSGDGADNTEILLNGTGNKPDTMPAMDVFAKAQWLESNTTYTVNVWLEAANYNHYVKEFTVTINARTGDTLTTQNIVNGIENILAGQYGSATAQQILYAINSYYYNGSSFETGFGKHFIFNSDYTIQGNAGTLTVESDGSTEFNVLYDRNWYVVEMILGRRYEERNWWWDTTHYQVATNTNGAFGTAGWRDVNTSRLPGINYDPNVINALDMGDYTYYRLNSGPFSTTYNYADGTERYLGPYGLYTDNHTIYYNNTNYTCAAYYIYAKYGADISALWPADGNSISVDYDDFGYNYVSLGTNSSSQYFNANSNPNILNVYSTMSDEILNNNDGGILTGSAGYEPDTNVDGKVYDEYSEPNAVMRSADVNHQMVAYWASSSPDYYYRLLEALDGTVRDSDVRYTLNYNAVGGTGSGSNVNIPSLNEGDIVKWNGKYYIVTGEPTAQYTTNTLSNQTQPAMQGFESMGKAYYQTDYNGNGHGNVYFLYNRERYNVDLYNVNGSYYLPESVLDHVFAAGEGTSTLRKQGFEMTNTETVNGVTCGTLTVKYGTDCTYLENVRDYLLNYGTDGTDTDDYDNRLGLRYANQTRGEKEWTFDDWYQDSSFATKAWDVTYCKSAYCNFVLYAKWDPPEYDMNIHIGRGEYQRPEHIKGQIWIDADRPSDTMADVTIDNEYIYTASAPEGGVVYVPYSPSAYGYRFLGWYYFNENHSHSDECRVYLKDILPSRADVRLYKPGYTYTDYFGRVRLVEEDENGELYYCSETRGLRYIFGETSPIYGNVDVYAAYESHNGEEYYVLHLIEKSQLDNNALTRPEEWQEVQINNNTYYIVKEEYVSGRKVDETYITNAEYGMSISQNGGVHYMFPEIDTQEVTMTNTLYQKADKLSENEYEYEGEENIFYTEETSGDDNKYTYYVIYKYSITSELPYRVWYVDIDEARRIGELTDEEGAHPYYTRYETPKATENIFLLPSEVKEINLEITDDNVMVTETARDIRGYTVIGDWQTDLELVAEGDYNNIYFYYRKQSNNALYNVKYHIMDSQNEYNGDKSIEIKYMPGVSGSDVRSENLAVYYERYISEALNAENEINGHLPEITVTDEGNTYTYNGSNKEEILSKCLEMLKGTVNDTDLSTPYIMVAANEEDKVIDVYMRFGSVKIIKYNEEGGKLEGARFMLKQKDPGGNYTGKEYEGVTDGKGEYVFNNLWIDDMYTYELTETTAPGDGYQLLKEPIDVKLPFTSAESLNNEYDYEDDEGNYYWYDVDCEVTDSVKFDLPMTGGRFDKGVMIAGVGLLFMAVMLMSFLSKKERGHNSINIKNIFKIKKQERGAIMKNSKFKRFLAALCSMVMLLSVFAVSAVAEPVFDGTQTGSITITKKDTGNQNFVSGVMFRTVKIADMEQYKATEDNVTTTSLKFKLTEAGTSILGTSMSGGVTSGDDTLYSSAEMKAGLDKLIENCGDSSKYTRIVTSVKGAAGSLNQKTDAANGQLTFSGLPLGVYLVVEDLDNSNPLINGEGEKVTINKASVPFLVTVPQTSATGDEWEYDVNVTPKNIVNSGEAEKTVTGTVAGTDGVNDTNTSTVGDTITYTVTSKILVTTDDTAYEMFELKDTAGKGISYDNFAEDNTPAFITATLGDTPLAENTDYNLTINKVNNSFTVDFTAAGLEKLNGVTEDTTITFIYTGQLNESAVSGEEGITRNTAEIDYQLKGDDITPDDPEPVDVITHDIAVTKEFVGDVTEINGTNIGDVKFTLAKKGEESDTKLYGKLVSDSTGSYYVVNTDITADAEGYTDEFACVLTSAGGSTGSLNIKGLANGDYVLTEVSTIDDFSLLKDPIEVTVADGTATITVVNEEKPIFELPLTGGSGTWVYTVGGMALIGVAVVMVAKMGKKKTA